MGDAVFVGTVAMVVGMGGFVALGAIGGLLCFWLDKRTDHGATH